MVETSDNSSPNHQVLLVQALFIRHQIELRGLLLAILGDFSAVDDVLQETFLTVTAKADDFVEGTNFTAWAAAIARFHGLEWRRKHGRITTGLSDSVIDQLCAEPGAIAADGAADREMQALEQCLESLAPSAREAISLRYREGHKPAEVARHLGWKVEAIYVVLSRARAALRQCVEKQMALEGEAS